MDSEFSGQRGVYIDGKASIFARVWAALKDMRGSTRRLIDEVPSEGRIIFYLVLSDLIFFLSWTLKTLIYPTSTSDTAPVVIGLWLVIALMVRTAMFYMSSVIVWVMCKGVGGTGSWRDTKAGMFWGSLVSAPYGFAAALLTILLIQFEGDSMTQIWAVLIPFLLAMVPFVWYISAAVSEAHRFTQSVILFTVLSIIVFGIILIPMYFNIESLA